MSEHTIPIDVEFTGGLEALFSSQRQHAVSLPSHYADPEDAEAAGDRKVEGKEKPADVAFLVRWLVENLLHGGRRELFVLDETVRPGILVLVNDADWELEGEGARLLSPGDRVLFVSTLHGG